LESDWRFGVWKWGLTLVEGHGAVSLAARLLPVGADTFILTNRLNDFGQATTYILPGGEFQPDFYTEGALNRLAPHFPYGYAVDPDHT